MIKKYISIAAVILVSLQIVAQDYNGKKMVGLTINGSSYNRLDEDEDDEYKNASAIDYNFQLKGGYFFSNNKLLGISLGYDRTRGNDDFPDDTTHAIRNENSYEIGPFFKEYFKLVNNFYFTLYVSPYYRYASLKNSFPDGEYSTYHTYRENDIYIAAIPGLSFELNRKLSFDFEIGFLNAYVKFRKVWDSPVDPEMNRQVIYGGSTALNDFGLDDLFLGFTYRFN
jgi:hypothetical protein